MNTFRHFKRMWTNGTSPTTRWSVSVHKGLYEEATAKLYELQQVLVDEYGDRINHFFMDKPPVSQRTGQYNTITDDDDDNWLDDDESIPDKAVIEQGFEKFMDDDQSEVSWGTNHTKYTEMINPSTHSTNTSSLTQEAIQVDMEEIERRHSAIEYYLVTQLKMDKEHIKKVLEHETPYRIVIRAVNEKIWDIDEILEGIAAIYQAQLLPKAPDLIHKDKNDGSD